MQLDLLKKLCGFGFEWFLRYYVVTTLIILHTITMGVGLEVNPWTVYWPLQWLDSAQQAVWQCPVASRMILGTKKSSFWEICPIGKFQKVNHWPKTTEITRKDCMYRHFAYMREKHGPKHFSFVPRTFVLPHEQSELQEAMSSNPKRNYNVKPSSSA